MNRPRSSVVREQGYKKCREKLHHCERQEGEMDSPRAAENSLTREESLLSLRKGQSLRLRHLGDWIVYEDDRAQTVIWYNHVARTSQLETPSEVREASIEHDEQAPMRLRKDGDWIEYTLPDDSVFYYNENTNDFRWQQPDELLSTASDEGPRAQSIKISGPIGREAGDWRAFKDPSTGLTFWHNPTTKESQWEPPAQIQLSEGAHNEEDGAMGGTAPLAIQETLREVHSVDTAFRT